MPFGTVKLSGGVNTVRTPTLNQGAISDSNFIRFRDSLVEKLGGWQRYISNGMGSVTRSLHAWRDLAGNSWLSAGSLSSFKVVSGTATTDITPQRLTTNPTPNFTATQGSNVIIITDPGVNNLTQSDSVFFNTPVSVGGIVISGGYQILPVPAGSTYTIQTVQYATTTANNAGSVPQFTSSSGSNIVTINMASHNLLSGSSVSFPIPTIVGGITILGEYNNITVTGTNSFSVIAGSQATSSQTVSMNSGFAQLVYGVVSAPSQLVSSGGWGPIGQFAIGQGYVTTSSAAPQTGTPITATDWATDNWGEIVVTCPKGGSIWYWDPNSGYGSMAPVGDGPQFNNGLFIAMPAQILVAWGSTQSIKSGATTDAQQDPLLIRWSDQLNFLQWKVTSATQAGSYHIPTGSEIRGGIQGATQAYIFTDVDCWAMQYLGYPLVFGFNQIGTGCGLVGQHAVTDMYGVTFWMNNSNFFYVGGGSGVQELPCPVWDTVFQDLDTLHASKCVAAANSQFNEIAFYYPSVQDNTGECSRYAKMNIKTGEWDIGQLPRSAWIDRSILGSPIGSDPTTTLLQQHEVGYSADGAAMDSYFETAYNAIGDGEGFYYVDYFEPDMKWRTVGGATSAQIGVTITAAESPNGFTEVSQTLTMTSTTGILYPRVRGRQMKWRMETNDATSWWRIGATRFRYAVDGRR